MEPVNELDYILQFLDANGVNMHEVAKELNKGYNYVKAQKTQKDPGLQSKKLLRNIKLKFAEKLKNLASYPKPYTPNETNQEANEDEPNYAKSSEIANTGEKPKEKNNHLLHSINNKLQVIIENQNKLDAKQQALAKYVAKKESGGDETRMKEILDQIERDAIAIEVPPTPDN
ncbi:hypothetical protein [Paraflavitalea speifideaquila]|uniref:hypothetical protein n=1 Tax=Paraflavitalea speifideaquila TaxID=3076558 RepID=UPI0028E702E2|nr:hypothetical protein [Paraflavitalea speifideiaquila]